jgi:hypothetical protein
MITQGNAFYVNEVELEPIYEYLKQKPTLQFNHATDFERII